MDVSTRTEGGGDGEYEEASCESTHFVEQAEVLRRLEVLAGPTPPASITGELEWLQKVLDKYQEQSTLLDPALEDMLVLTMGRARVIIMEWHSQHQPQQRPSSSSSCCTSSPLSFPIQVFDQPQLHGLFAFVYILCRLRGYKTIVKFFPHEATDLEPILHALRSQDRQNHERWQTRYGLLLWLSMLVLVPFDICSIDSGLENNGVTLVGALCNLAVEYLKDAGPTREAAAVCLAGLLKRPDMEAQQLAKFLTWAEGILTPSGEEGEGSEEGGGRRAAGAAAAAGAAVGGSPQCDTFLLLGVLQTLAVLLKAGHRQNLLAFLPSLLHCLARLDPRDFGSQTLNRKLKMKLLHRIGLAYLPPRVAAWRYQRGHRSLLDNLKKAKGEGGGGAAAAAVAAVEEEQEQEEEEEEEKEEEEEVPEDLEEIVEEILGGLRDRDTIVRWSAAKGLGRITSRLPLCYADEVVASVLTGFAEGASDSAWHGGCLALAELARRGLLLPGRLGEVVPVVTKALQYDVRRGQTSVGAHVRDAACYVCWAFARAYSPLVMREHVPRLAEGMLMTSLFDREINCRRAASAAFQENVGRQGHENFPHGIDILTVADYFTLGNRQVAFLEVSPAVARFGPYTRVAIDHLAGTKLRHWDCSIRKLTSVTLGRLVRLAPAYMSEEVLPFLLQEVDAVDLHRRHGALLGVAEVVLGLAALPHFGLGGEVGRGVVEVVPRIEQARLYRGRGGEYVRGAACRLIECVALAHVNLGVKRQLRLLDSVDENLRHPVEEVQEGAVAAVRAFTRSYFGGGGGGERGRAGERGGGGEEGRPSTPSARLQARVVDKYRGLVEKDENVAVTRGFVRALGALPARLLLPSLDLILGSLEELAREGRKVGDEPDAETRRNALWALVEVTHTLGVQGRREGGREGWMNREQVQRVLRILLRSLGDYAMDKRGDIGSWVRMAALQGLASVVRVVREEGREGGREEGKICVGERVVTAYGEGKVREVRCEGEVCVVQFEEGQAGSFFFPYGPGVGLLSRAACRPLGRVEGGAKEEGKEGTAAADTMIIGFDGGENAGGAAGGAASSSSLIDPVLMTNIISAVLKQFSEKLDAVRECAGHVLLQLLPLAHDAAGYSFLISLFFGRGLGEKCGKRSGSTAITTTNHNNNNKNITTTATTSNSSISSSNSCINKRREENEAILFRGGAPSEVFPRVVCLLEIEQYHSEVLAGLVVSVGGLTESVVKASLGAVMEWAQQQQQQVEEGKDKGEDGVNLVKKLGVSMLALFDAHVGDDRVIWPLLRSVDLFYQKGIFAVEEGRERGEEWREEGVGNEGGGGGGGRNRRASPGGWLIGSAGN